MFSDLVSERSLKQKRDFQKFNTNCQQFVWCLTKGAGQSSKHEAGIKSISICKERCSAARGSRRSRERLFVMFCGDFWIGRALCKQGVHSPVCNLPAWFQFVLLNLILTCIFRCKAGWTLDVPKSELSVKCHVWVIRATFADIQTLWEGMHTTQTPFAVSLWLTPRPFPFFCPSSSGTWPPFFFVSATSHFTIWVEETVMGYLFSAKCKVTGHLS